MDISSSITVLIPCYQEQEVLPTTYKRVRAVLDNLSPQVVGRILFVDDGSSDSTKAIIESICSLDRSVQAIFFSRNFGHQAAVTAALSYCNSDYAIIMDADLQDPPELIPAMWDLLHKTKANVIYGVRNKREGETHFKKLSAKLFYRYLNYLSDCPIPLDTGDFRLVDRQVIDAFRQLPEHNKYVRGLISWLGFRQEPFYYDRDERKAGNTKYGLKQMLNLATNALHYFSTKPLKLASSLGYICVLIGMAWGIWVLCGKIWGFTHPETGWTSILMTIIFFGGVQLLCIGLLGRYVGVIFDEVKSRPEYIVAKTINVDVTKQE